jgi:hypothetical protein
LLAQSQSVTAPSFVVKLNAWSRGRDQLAYRVVEQRAQGLMVGGMIGADASSQRARILLVPIHASAVGRSPRDERARETSV